MQTEPTRTMTSSGARPSLQLLLATPAASFLAVTAWLRISEVPTDPALRCRAVIAFFLMSLPPIFVAA